MSVISMFEGLDVLPDINLNTTLQYGCLVSVRRQADQQHPQKPVPALTGTGYQWVWVRVDPFLPMGYP